MIEIDKQIVSTALFDTQFVCDLKTCKGACCVQGDSGAPLDKEESEILERDFNKISPYLRQEGKQAISEQGKYIIDSDGDLVTPLVNNTECAYVIFDENSTALCGIEKAYIEGKTNFKKPISCHLYPIRSTKYSKFEALNFHEWEICKSACACGIKLGVPTFQFCKESLIRKYGEEWYEKLEIAYRLFQETKTKP